MFIFKNNLNLWILLTVTVSITSVIPDLLADNYTRYSKRNRANLRRQLPARTYDYDSVY